MANKPKFTVAEAESNVLTVCGARPITVNSKDARNAVRPYCTAKGWPAPFVYALTYAELAAAFNSEEGWNQVAKKLEGIEQELEESEPQTVTQTVPAPRVATSDADRKLETLREILAGAVDESRVREIVQEAISGIKPRGVTVSIDGRQPITIKERTNPIFDRVLKLAARGRNVAIVGPAGCGKTHLASQVARALGRDYGEISGGAGVSESEIRGWYLPVTGGAFEYQAAEFIKLYERGNAVFCFDELDSFDPNVLFVVQTATSNAHMNVHLRRDKPRVARGPNVSLLATLNTFGTGADPVYSSRAELDGATIDRWFFITMDYDRDLERDLAQAGGLSESELRDIWTLREKVQAAGLRRIISTRAIEKAIDSKAIGDSWSQTMASLVEGWSRDDKVRAGQGK